MLDLSQRFDNCLLNILLSQLLLFVLLVVVRVTLDVEVAKVLEFLDLGLEGVFLGKFGEHVVIGLDFSLFDQLLLILDFVEFLLQVSQLLSLGGEEKVVKFRELERRDVSLLLVVFGLL